MSSFTSPEAPCSELDFILTYFYFSTANLLFFPAVLSWLYLMIHEPFSKHEKIFPTFKLIDVIPCKSRRWSAVANTIKFLSQHIDL